VQTWEKIPGDLQNLIVKRIVKTIEDRITQQHGIQQESTVGFDDDIDALRRELGSEYSSDTTSASSQILIDPRLV
jgi:hypothetical protein